MTHYARSIGRDLFNEAREQLWRGRPHASEVAERADHQVPNAKQPRDLGKRAAYK